MANFKAYKQVDVSLAGHSYSITICHGGLERPDLLQALVKSSQVLIVTNQTIAPLYLSYLQSAFVDIQCDVVILEDGECHKTEYSLFAIYDALIQNKHHRDTTIIALGGGVIGDLAGFAASTYQRGIDFVQIPTTLLAQVDASVGGKTAINHPLGKNMIGSFYQPKAVFIDISTLKTLPEREFRAGLAEVIKYGILEGGEFLEQLTLLLQRGIHFNSSYLDQLIAQCCQIKARFVEVDEKETGQRALLNLGHTFAHALEAYTSYQQWLHGEAVSIGLYCAAIMSYQKNWINEQQLKQIEQMLQDACLPYKIPSTIDLKKLQDLMQLDKKIKNNCLRFVLIKQPGDCYLETKITKDCLHKTLLASSLDGAQSA